jgi:DNA primase
VADQETIQKIKEATNIVDVVSEQVLLKRSGSQLKGLSPFSQEKSPSFFVNPESQTFYCFSTNQGGDVIDFLMLTKGLSFREAIEALSEKTGIPISNVQRSPEEMAAAQKEAELRRVYLKLNRYAAHYFKQQFEGDLGAEAREYAKKRALTPATINAFAIGFAPDSWTGLRDYLMTVQAPLVRAVELGLLRPRQGEKPKEDGSNLFDTFRSRLMFPIRDSHGEVVAFGGRYLGTESAEAPKYLNSPESPIYNKSSTLYNLDRARKHIRSQDLVVLVEGYMDCIALDQAGLSYAVANCGTALTPTHVKMLKSHASRVVSLYDTDEAGKRATERNMDLFLEVEGFPLLAGTVPQGKDPDEYLRTHEEAGARELERQIESSPAIIDLWIDSQIKKTAQNLQARTNSLEKIAEKLSKLRQDLWIQARIPGVAAGLGVDLALVVSAIRKFKKDFRYSAGQSESRASQKIKQNQIQSGKKTVGHGTRFLTHVLQYRGWVTKVRSLSPERLQKMLAQLADDDIRTAFQILSAPLKANETEVNAVEAFQSWARENSQMRNLAAEALAKFGLEEAPEGMFEAALEMLNKQDLERKSKELSAKIQEADGRGDYEASELYQKQLATVIRELKIGV